MKYIYLSHFISDSTPLYGGANNIEIKKDKSISKNDSANTHLLSFPNHTGTHIDFPYHFSENGKTINDYNAEFWIFEKPYIIDLNSTHNEIIDSPDIFEKIPFGTDFLIIKTGFQKYRNSVEYWNNNPGIHPSLAEIIKIKGVRAIGLDLISISSFQNRTLGRLAHKAFLIDNDILIVEDMNLKDLPEKLNRIICTPLLVDKIDGAPVTIIGEFE